MLGSFLKYSACVVGGAVLYAACVHHADENAYDTIKAHIEDHERLVRANGDVSDEELREAMRAYIKANRGLWENTYVTADVGRRLEKLYSAWA